MEKEKLQIVKIGGQLIEDEDHLNQVLDTFSAMSGRKILIHGGGRRASELLQQLGIPPRMIDGRRITDIPTLEVVTMVYAGLINKKIIAKLQSNSCNALGLSGADANIILAKKREVKEIDYGFAGDIYKINNQSIKKLLTDDFTPVFCAITHDGQGQLLNTNADTIAAEVAKAMASEYEVNLYYCFERKGVQMNPDDEESFLQQLDFQQYKSLKKEGIISAGMIPKLDNAFGVLQCPVNKVIIGDIQSLSGKTGTILKN